jgi:hypothetical protein
MNINLKIYACKFDSGDAQECNQAQSSESNKLDKELR